VERTTDPLELACQTERKDWVATRLGLPAIGYKMTNAHGIEWLVEVTQGYPPPKPVGNPFLVTPVMRKGQGMEQNLSTGVVYRSETSLIKLYVLD
jgi:hypothetical protein